MAEAFTGSGMSTCVLRFSSEAWGLPPSIRQSWSYQLCPSCPCQKTNLACVDEACRPVNSGFIELGRGAWDDRNASLTTAVGFRACVERCEDSECGAFLLEDSGRCWLMDDQNGLSLDSGGRQKELGLVPHLLVPRGNDVDGDEETERFSRDGDGDGGLLLQALPKLVLCVVKTAHLERFLYFRAALTAGRALPAIIPMVTCVWWHLVLIIGLLALSSGIIFLLHHMAKRHRRKRTETRQEEVSRILQEFEDELWDEKPETLN
ncbi:Ankyrin repeat and SAM domain-containing protein 1A, partial [Durusdinium trenchii]